MTIKVDVKMHGMEKLFSTINTIQTNAGKGPTVRVGVLKQIDRSYPGRPEISAAQVAIWQNYGAAGKPAYVARPFMDLAVPFILRSKVIKEAFNLTDITEFGFNVHMANSIGAEATRIIKRVISKNDLYQPLAKRTIRKKGHEKILRERYILQQSIDYEVLDAKGRKFDVFAMGAHDLARGGLAWFKGRRNWLKTYEGASNLNTGITELYEGNRLKRFDFGESYPPLLKDRAKYEIK